MDIRAIRSFPIIVCSLFATPTLAAEIAVNCKGQSTTFSALPGIRPSVKTEIAPDQTFIFDEEKQLVWRWLEPLNKRDKMCDDLSCVKTFTASSISLFWQPKDDVYEWQWGLQLDRLTGHGVFYWQFGRANELHHVRVDMVCSATSVPIPANPKRAF